AARDPAAGHPARLRHRRRAGILGARRRRVPVARHPLPAAGAAHPHPVALLPGAAGDRRRARPLAARRRRGGRLRPVAADPHPRALAPVIDAVAGRPGGAARLGRRRVFLLRRRGWRDRARGGLGGGGGALAAAALGPRGALALLLLRLLVDDLVHPHGEPGALELLRHLGPDGEAAALVVAGRVDRTPGAALGAAVWALAEELELTRPALGLHPLPAAARRRRGRRGAGRRRAGCRGPGGGGARSGGVVRSGGGVVRSGGVASRSGVRLSLGAAGQQRLPAGVVVADLGHLAVRVGEPEERPAGGDQLGVDLEPAVGVIRLAR